MTLPEPLPAVLPPEAQTIWTTIAELLPPAAYLVGGTAMAIRLRHRVSNDLDFFLERPADLDELESSLRAAGSLVVGEKDARTLNCIFNSSKLQFLGAEDQRVVEPTTQFGGIRVAGLGDLIATKLNALVGRPELRDYFDLMTAEQQAHRFVEEGLALFLERYRPAAPDQAIRAIVNALAYLGDVEEDPALPVGVAEVERYWSRRVREVVVHLDRGGLTPR